MKGRVFLVVTYDVTGLEKEEIDALSLEAAVQAEESSEWPDEGHRGVPEPEVHITRPLTRMDVALEKLGG